MQRFFSDLNSENVSNIWGRVGGNILNSPSNYVGHFFDYSSSQYCRLQFYFVDSQPNFIYMRKMVEDEQPFFNWKQIYPDYSDIALAISGYIIFTNGLIIQYGNKTTTFHSGFQDIHLSISFLNSFVYTVNFKNDIYIPIKLNQNLSTLEFIPCKISDGTEIYTGTYQVFYIAIGS